MLLLEVCSDNVRHIGEGAQLFRGQEVDEAVPDHLPLDARHLRIRSLGSALFAIAADLERDRENG